jgi:hypothetical protein
MIARLVAIAEGMVTVNAPSALGVRAPVGSPSVGATSACATIMVYRLTLRNEDADVLPHDRATSTDSVVVGR